MNYGTHNSTSRSTYKIVLIIIVFTVTNIPFPSTANGQICLDKINVVDILKNEAWNASINGSNFIDPGDIVVPINNAIVALWKRYYSSGEVRVIDEGILIATSFEAGNEGYAGLFIKYGRLLSYTRINVKVKVLKDCGGSIVIVLHSMWDNGIGGDKPKDPVLTVTLVPLEAKLYVNNREYRLDNQKEYSINITIIDNKANITIGSTSVLSKLLPGNYSYITLMALSSSPGKSIEFIVKEFTICSIESSRYAPPHQEYNPPSFIVIKTSTELDKIVNTTTCSIGNIPNIVATETLDYENKSLEDVLTHTIMYFISNIILILIIATVVVFYFRFRK